MKGELEQISILAEFCAQVFFGNISNDVLIVNCNANMVLGCFFISQMKSYFKLQIAMPLWCSGVVFLNISNEVFIQIANCNAKEENIAWGKLQLARDEESVEKKKLIQLQVILEIQRRIWWWWWLNMNENVVENLNQIFRTRGGSW